MQFFDVRSFLLRATDRGEDARGATEQSGFPLRDLLRTHIQPLGQLRERRITFERCQGHHLRLDGQ